MFVERVVFLIVVAGVLLWAAVEAGSFADRARILPQLVAVAGLVIIGVELARMLWKRFVRLEVDEVGAVSALAQLRAGAPYLLWILGYYMLIWLIGFAAASAVFVAAFLMAVARMRPVRALAGALAVVGVLVVLHVALDVRWPEGWVKGLIPDAEASVASTAGD